jgi:hypothetical protein
VDKLNPDALAEWSDEQGTPDPEVRPNVQRDVTPQMITAYVIAIEALPSESAQPFGEYLDHAWNDYVETENVTQRDLITGALDYWRGTT